MEMENHSTNQNNITSLDFEYIKNVDDVTYCKALFGDFVVLMMRTNDHRNGFINATKLCTLGGKHFKEWLKTQSNKELMQTFNNKLYKTDGEDIPLRKVIEIIAPGGDNNDISGSYVHSKLIVHIASWVSPDFAFKVSEIVENYLIDRYTLELTCDKEQLEFKIQELVAKQEQNQNKIERYEDKYENDIKPYVINKPADENVYNIFVLLKLSDTKYYIMRGQRKSFNERLDNLKQKYRNFKVVFYWKNIPNSNYLYNKMKENLCEKLSFNRNELTVIDTDYKTKHLVIDIALLCDEKIELVEHCRESTFGKFIAFKAFKL